MTNPKVSDLVLEYIESVWNQGDARALERLTAPGFEYRLGGQPARDRSAMADFVALVRRAFPDWRVRVLSTVSEGHEVAVRWEGSVTHEGEFHGIPPTGKQVHVSGINMYRTEDGRIVREWEQMDSIGMLQQLK
ncbi:MAG: ester cyclase [Lysobacterales bacterium]|jgi:steroid delta-isomerase-like uncharacterized protein